MDWTACHCGEDKVGTAAFAELLLKFDDERGGDFYGASRVPGLERASLRRMDVGSELLPDANDPFLEVNVSRVQPE